MIAVDSPTVAHWKAGAADASPMVAVLPWGDVIEDFLDEINVSLDDFASGMTGGWLFGYIESLRLYGIRTTIICFSARVTATRTLVHQPSGSPLVILPAPRLYRALRRRMRDPYGCSVHAMFGDAGQPGRSLLRLAHHVAPYLGTPVLALLRAIKHAGCSAVICQEYESPRFDAAVLAGRLLGVPVFGSFQGGNWHRSGIERWVRPWALRRSAGLIIGSSVEAARVRAAYALPETKIAKIFNPLDLSEGRLVPREEARRQLQISPTAQVAVWHGRIDIRRKGLDILLEVWEQICTTEADRDLVLLVVGDGVDSDRFAAEVERMGLSRIRWIREYVLDKGMIYRYLCAADVYLFPSRHEGFPVAPLEAMACGLPVIAAAAPGVADILDADEASGGIIVPVANAEAMAGALGRLLGTPGLAQMLGARARLRIEQAFSTRMIGAQLQTLLASAVGAKQQPVQHT